MKVAPLVGGVINGAGICDIQFINVSCSTLIADFEYLIQISVLFKKKYLLHECGMEGINA
jgi:hypothetical protein